MFNRSNFSICFVLLASAVGCKDTNQKAQEVHAPQDLTAEPQSTEFQEILSENNELLRAMLADPDTLDLAEPENLLGNWRGPTALSQSGMLSLSLRSNGEWESENLLGRDEVGSWKLYLNMIQLYEGDMEDGEAISAIYRTQKGFYLLHGGMPVEIAKEQSREGSP